MSNSIYAIIGLEARQASAAATGHDPGEVVPLDLSGLGEEQRRDLLAHARVAQGCGSGKIPKGCLYVQAVGATSADPLAVLVYLRERARQKQVHEAKQKVEYEARKQRQEKQRAAEIARLREAPVGDLVRNHYGPWEIVPFAKEVGRLEEARAEVDRINHEKAKQKAQAQAEEEAWIAQHGSPRLLRLLEEEIELGAVYRDERVALERPSWVWNAEVPGSLDNPRNPPMEAFVLLDRAREQEPEAVLRWLHEEHEHDEDCYGDEDGCPRLEVDEYVAFAKFLGWTILLRA